MPQGSKYDENGKLIWKFDICCEFDCNTKYAKENKIDCGGDFTKPPCMFYGEHKELNLEPEYDGPEPEGNNEDMSTVRFGPV